MASNIRRFDGNWELSWMTGRSTPVKAFCRHRQVDFIPRSESCLRYYGKSNSVVDRFTQYMHCKTSERQTVQTSPCGIFNQHTAYNLSYRARVFEWFNILSCCSEISITPCACGEGCRKDGSSPCSQASPLFKLARDR